MKLFLILLCCLCTLFLNAQEPTLVWAKSMGGATSIDQGKSIAVDAAGNVYTTGFFQGTADFDPGPGIYNLTSSVFENAFVSKLDASGNFVWAKNLVGSQPNRGASIAVDAAGNVYTTGEFFGTADFDPGPGTFNLAGSGAFIWKLDAAGNLVWAKSMGSPISDTRAYSLTLDAAGNVYTTGRFNDTVDFDPGPGIFNLTTSNPYAVFITKLSSAGNFIWAKTIGGGSFDFGGTLEVPSIAVDAAGNVYTTGGFRGTADFDPGPGTFNLTKNGSNSDIFVSKLDASGNFVWAKQMGSAFAAFGLSIAVDVAGNVYTTGFYATTIFSRTTDFDPGPGIFNLEGNGSYVSKLDAAGNFVWAKHLTNGRSYSIDVDAAGYVYTTGRFGGPDDFDPSPDTFNLVTNGGQDIFISKLDAAGSFVSAVNIGGPREDQGGSLTLDAAGNIYATGYFFGNTESGFGNGPADFDPGPGVFNLTSNGNDIFVVKLAQTPGVNTAPRFNGLPLNNGINLTEGQTANFTIQATGPEINQTVNTAINTNGICGITANITNGTVSTINLSVTAMPCNVGTNTITLTATDNGSPSLSTTTTINIVISPPPCTLSASAIASGSIVTINATNGTAPYTYTLGNQTNNTGIFSAVSPGNYNYSVKDARNCTVTGTIVVVPPSSGDACPKDTIFTLSSCTATTTVTWAVPQDTFTASIQVSTGVVPFRQNGTAEGRLFFLGTFNGHGYYRSIDAYQWTTANNIATSFGTAAMGHLATLTSAAENAFVVGRLNQPGFGSFSWIGLRRTGTGPTQFQWVTGEPFSYTNWGPLDPNNFGGSANNLVEPYVHLYEGNGRWHDLLDIPLPFLAEFDTTLIRWRQTSGPQNGSSLGVGVYTVCYERTNVITAQRDTCCFTVTVQCPGTLTTQAVVDANKVKEVVTTSSLQVMALPNPAPNGFMLRIAGDDAKGRISLKVMDLAGRIIEARDGMAANQTFLIGSRYRPGVYLVQVVQGGRSAVLKLIKQSD